MALLQCQFYSKVLGLSSSMNVILPQIESNGTTYKHQILYLLHGISDDHTIWQRRTSIERYVAEKNVAVIMPAVQRSFYTDMVYGYRYWTYISEELPAIARSFFHLSDSREDIFAAGFSMGGYGAFKLAMAYPERFAAAASISGALDIMNTTKLDNQRWQSEIPLIFGDPENIPGSSNDLFSLAEQLSKQKEPRPRFYQCCGKSDMFREDNLRFRDWLQSLNLDVSYEERSGDHTWEYCDQQIQKIINWLPLRSIAQ